MPDCPLCGTPLMGTSHDPIVSAASLGPGTYHLECARAAWRDKAREANERRAELQRRRSQLCRLRFWAHPDHHPKPNEDNEP